MLKDDKGNKLYRKVEVRIIFPEKIFPDRKISQHAPAHKGFSEDSIDEIIESIADQLDTLYPFWEFKEQRLAAEGRTAKVVISFAGYNKAVLDKMKQEQAEQAAAAETTQQESSAPAPETQEAS